MTRIGQLLWQGLWQGFGFEISFLVIFGVWSVFYHNHKHRFGADHIIHTIHDYFTN